MRLPAIAGLALSGVLCAAAPEGAAAQGADAECVQEPSGDSSMHRHCWDGGKRRGRWVVRLPGGEVREGAYVAGKKQGHWVIRLADGGVQEGPYVDGVKEGRWVLRHADGTVEEGSVVDGLREGRWVARRPDGSRRTFEMVGGALVAGSASAPVAPRPLALGRDERRRIQSCLKAQGHDPGPADGVFGARTRAAIRGWQAAKGGGAPATGRLTRAHADTLLSACQVAEHEDEAQAGAEEAASGKRAGAPDPGAVCTGKETSGEWGPGCWREVRNQPGCYIWDSNPGPGKTVAWSGGCAGGKAAGMGESAWRWGKDGRTFFLEGPYRDGDRQDGHWILRMEEGGWGIAWEGPIVDGKNHGYWVRRGTEGAEWKCWWQGEEDSGATCIDTWTDEVHEMQAAVPAVLSSGPGEQYEELSARLAVGEKVLVWGRLGDWLRVGRHGDLVLKFVHASKLEEATGSSWSAGHKFRDCPECPEMVVVPPGSFEMGSPPRMAVAYLEDEGPRVMNEEEGPVHRVTFERPFVVGVYEVTFGEWDACVSGGGCDGYRPDDEGWGRDRRPVIKVSWEDAKAYVEWLSEKTGEGYRLLSESEWEYVARAGTTTQYWWGEDYYDQNRANCRGCGSRWDDRQTAPVGSFPANPFGLHDVHGNVEEWVEDCWNDSYNGAPTDGSAWVSGDCGHRVLRGASWSTGQVHSASRGPSLFAQWSLVWRGSIDTGFRVARTLD